MAEKVLQCFQLFEIESLLVSFNLHCHAYSKAWLLEFSQQIHKNAST